LHQILKEEISSFKYFFFSPCTV